MMKLVDMQGLKPCPLMGPGSSPGIGIRQVYIIPITCTEPKN